MNLNEDIKRIKEVMGIKIINEGSVDVGDFTVDIENGPANHAKRKLGNWASDNAWDFFAKPGTVVNSFTNGKVSNVYDNGKKSGAVYGTQVSITGIGGYPDIFYTHLTNVQLEKGQEVKVGDYIGEVKEWCADESCTKQNSGTHVHIGLPYGKHIKDLLDNEGDIFSGKRNNTDGTSTDTSSNISHKIFKDVISGIFGTD